MISIIKRVQSPLFCWILSLNRGKFSSYKYIKSIKKEHNMKEILVLLKKILEELKTLNQNVWVLIEREMDE
tara:strand:+ start:432 stop:644 length:213 start_codon:yes stop_codon:yes gene_type:complete